MGLQNERRTLETKAKKQEETWIEEVDKLGKEVKRLKEEVVRLKVGCDENKEEKKKEKEADIRGDQRRERTKDFLANHTKSTSTDKNTYLREKIVKLQIDQNSESDRIDIRATKDTEGELQMLQDEVAKLQNERRTLETKAKKQEETWIEEVDKLGK